MKGEAMSITEFLLARITEDEAVARAATAGPWRHNPRKVWYQDANKLRAARSGNPFITGGEEFVGAGPDDGDNETTVGVATTGPEDDPQAMADAAFIARHDPARVLAECAAKRAIIDEHREGRFFTTHQGCVVCRTGDGPMLPVNYPCPTVRALATIYANHPDYRPEWAL
jgi:hypothetical protein